MVATTALQNRFPRTAATVSRYGDAPARHMVEIGQMVWFAVSAIAQIPFALTRYRREFIRMIAQMGMGTGAMAVAGGTAAIVGFITLSAGSLVAIQGFASLGNIGVEAFTGFLAAMVNVRFVAPVAAGQALAATVGAGATAELGAMRISEEIDALEVMSIRSIAYLVSTRVVAGLVVIIPLYGLAITLAFLSAQATTVLFYGQSPGTYNHYFHTFLRLDDVAWSFAEVILVAVVVMTTHCYYGYTAKGGPVGVGEAVGRSMRLSLITIVIVVVLTAMSVYGKNPNFNLTV
ncbi:MlaE family ABC transporter permease [Mycobacterium bourgelatii]|uniref:ABC transporter permease n=1 Tax=Mycobacterium bourgelatii TaxID=1273442 RepID=A0A7I9YPA7_MYCBU|nr:ABC transporter permease [Mycobacterium bourgelatii]MCV6973876.1 ABC transporter permease [Mycobacterium bourgelatii]GFG90509.1 ABC transporter permease [Mycobacterium bourgelatii]